MASKLKPGRTSASGAVPAAAPPVRVLELSEAASASAPFIYFEEVPTFGLMGGVVRLALSALRISPGAVVGAVKTDRVLVAHLRTNLIGARMLRDALDKALLMANPADTGPTS